MVKRLLLLLATAAMAMLVATPAALAQAGDLDCADFATQEEAQAMLDADPSDPNGLDADGDGVACETLPSGGMEDGTMTDGANEDAGTTEQNDLDCVDFATQAEAQATYDADPSDPNGLDADGDGIACESTESAGEISYEDGTIIFVTTAGPLQPDASADQYTDDEVADDDTTALPDTGGPGILLPIAGLLLASGLLGLRVARRK